MRSNGELKSAQPAAPGARRQNFAGVDRVVGLPRTERVNGMVGNAAGAEAFSQMKPIQIALAPTRSRPLNMFLGVVLALVSLLFFCALATYHASDPSWNTAADPACARQRSPTGLGLSAHSSATCCCNGLGSRPFCCRCGWAAWPGAGCGLGPADRRCCEWRDRHVAVVYARPVCPAAVALALGACRSGGRRHGSAGLGHAGGVPQCSGRLDRCLRAGGGGFYFASAISFWAVKETLADRWIHLQSLYDRWRNWRDARADRRAEEDEYRRAE